MDFSLWPNPERSYAETAQLVAQVEAAEWYGAYVADHFMANVDVGQPAPGPLLEATATLAALAASTSTIRLGSLVLSATYRHPAVLANWAATCDQVSGGRLILGLGAGWQENEHAAYGLPLGPLATRVDRFEEYVQVVRLLTERETVDFAGEYFTLEGARCEPAPKQQPLPILLGVKGERRTLRIAAARADIWNSWCTPAELAHRNALLDGHCDDLGRDPSTLRRTTQAMVLPTATTAEGERRKAEAQGRPLVVGTSAQMLEQLAAYAAAGCAEFIVPTWLLGETAEALEALERFDLEVVRPLRAS